MNTPSEQLPARLLQSLVQAANSGIVVTDACSPDNPIIFANDAFYQMTGYDTSQTLGFNCRFLQGEDRQQREISVLRSSIEHGDYCKVVLRNYRKDGARFWNELYVSPYFNDDGQLVNFLGVQHDVTEAVEYRLEREMFNAGIIHDIKSPLVGQTRILEYLTKQNHLQASEMEKIHGVMLGSLQKSMSLINDTLKHFKLENDLVVPEYTSFSASGIVNEVIASSLQDSKEKTISVGCMQPQGDFNLSADKSMLFRAIKNLVDNAISYSQPGKEIWIITSETRDEVLITVADQGSGLPAQLVKQLQSSAEVIRSSFQSNMRHKTGLGLLTCVQIMRAHKGSLRLVKSDLQGTELTLILPKAIALDKQPGERP